MSDKLSFSHYVEEYQKCLNTYYDRFFNKENISLDNICQSELANLKHFERLYKPFETEYINNKNKLD
jgi:hypothetical protein